MNTMTRAERARRCALEVVIEDGLATFYGVGKALLEIRDSRLYRSSHDTWEDYCRSRWKMTRVHAWRLIEAAAVVDDGIQIGNEAQARELVPLTPEQRQEVWTEATADGAQPTAARLHELANRMLAGLPPEAQQETVAQAEVAVMERQSSPADEVRTGKIERALKWLMRAWAEMEDMGNDADAFLNSLDGAVAALKALRDE